MVSNRISQPALCNIWLKCSLNQLRDGQCLKEVMHLGVVNNTGTGVLTLENRDREYYCTGSLACSDLVIKTKLKTLLMIIISGHFFHNTDFYRTSKTYLSGCDGNISHPLLTCRAGIRTQLDRYGLLVSNRVTKASSWCLLLSFRSTPVGRRKRQKQRR